MVRLLTYSAVSLTCVNAAIGLWLIAYRLTNNRRLHALTVARERLKPAVLAWIDGDDEPPSQTNPTDYLAIADLLASYGRAVRGGARKRVADLARETGMIDRMIRELRARRGWRRAVAAYGLGDLASRQDAAQALLACLGDRDRRVTAASARSLGLLGAVEAVEPLVRGLASGHLTRPVGAHALRLLGGEASASLVEMLKADEEEVRAMAAELLGLIGNVGRTDQLIEVLSDPSPDVRVRATRALGRIGDSSASAALQVTLSDPVSFVRAAAATALAKVGNSDSFEQLVLIAQNDVFVSAHAAAYAAAFLRPEDVEQLATRENAGIHLQEAADLLQVVG